MRIGVDVGGTFTDVVVVDATGRTWAFKSPSRPADPKGGVLAALDVAAAGLDLVRSEMLSRCAGLIHGSTIATNTVLERKGARVGLLTTEGFRDWLEIRRGQRPDPWDHRSPFPDPLVPRSLRLSVGERIAADGSILRTLAEDDVRAAAASFRRAEVESVAICLLHSYRNPVHEQRVAQILAEEMPGVPVSLSSVVAPVMGEYERGSTTVVNAYVAPRVVPYLRELENALAAEGLGPRLLLVGSNGGAAMVEEMALRPVQLVLSGPAAGVGSLSYYEADTGASALISIEVGGTSCDVTLSRAGKVAATDQLDVGGSAIVTPAVEIHTVGAGGGTIARLDAAGMLLAGPEGAGARPGPACYGLGGERPTVTDCQLVLGRLKPGPYAGGAISLDLARARDAVRRHVADPLGVPVEDAAAGILSLVEQTIQHAVERVSLERGHDPREFTLVACGGAGPLHGPATARALGCRATYVPRLAGVFCALGMCNADVRQDHVRSFPGELQDGAGDSLAALRAEVDAMRAEALVSLRRQGFPEEDTATVVSLDMRYAGQQAPIRVEPDALSVAALKEAFEREHARLYGHLQPGGRIEFVNLRVSGIGRTPGLPMVNLPPSEVPPEPGEMREVWVDRASGWRSTPVFAGQALLPGHRVAGPAIVEEGTTTLIVGAGEELSVTRAGNYLIPAVERAA
nr:hydantoinase/oxoprolinase family protein [Siccirubricoccus soli]